MKVKLAKDWFAPNGAYYRARGGVVVDIPNELKKDLPKSAKIVDGPKKAAAPEQSDGEREQLLEEAKALGLNPHPNTGAEKLKAAIEEAQGEGDDEE